MQMHQRIADLSKHKDQASNSINRRLIRRRGQGVGLVDEVGAQQTGAGPVEVAVAEDVDPGHRGGGELVDEKGLEFALEEVQLEHGEDDPLGLGELEGLRGTGVDVGSEGTGEEGVDEDGTEVFDEEHIAPCDLVACTTMYQRQLGRGVKASRTEILNRNLASSYHSRDIRNTSLTVLQSLPGLEIEETNAVVIAQPDGLCDQNLDILNGGIWGDRDLGGELLDGGLGG